MISRKIKRDRKLHEVKIDSNDSQEDLACLELYTIQENICDNYVIWLTPKIQLEFSSR